MFMIFYSRHGGSGSRELERPPRSRRGFSFLLKSKVLQVTCLKFTAVF